MVSDLSDAEIPVVVPINESTDTVNAVLKLAVLLETIRGKFKRSSWSPSMGTQIKPRP